MDPEAEKQVLKAQRIILLVMIIGMVLPFLLAYWLGGF